MKTTDLTDMKYQLNRQFIHKLVLAHGVLPSYEENMSEGWCVFLNAQRDYHTVRGCCGFYTYATFCIVEHFEALRQKRNERIALESRLSLDQSFENGETVGQRYARKQGDFTKAVALWDFIDRQGGDKTYILRQLIRGYQDHEIIETSYIEDYRYYQMLEELQAAFSEWVIN